MTDIVRVLQVSRWDAKQMRSGDAFRCYAVIGVCPAVVQLSSTSAESHSYDNVKLYTGFDIQELTDEYSSNVD